MWSFLRWRRLCCLLMVPDKWGGKRGFVRRDRVRSLHALHILSGHGNDRGVRTPVELHACDHDHRLVVAVVVHADPLVPKIRDAGAAGRAAVFGDLAIERMVGEVAVLFRGREVFAQALHGSADAGDGRDRARLLRCVAGGRRFGRCRHARKRERGDEG